MELNVTKNAGKGIIMGIINKMAFAILPFVIRTMTLQIVGINFLGVRSLFSSILQVLNLAELGFGEAIVYCMYKPIAENDNEKIRKLLSLYRFIYFSIAFFITLVGLLLIPVLPTLIKDEIPDGINIVLVYLVILANTVASYLFGSYKKSILTAYQRADITYNISTIFGVASNIVEILVLLLVNNVYVYLSVAAFFTVFSNLFSLLLVNKKFPQFRKIDYHVSFDLLKEIKANIFGLFLSKICDVVRGSVNNIFISLYLGVALVAIYNNYYMIVTTLTGFITVIYGSLVAGIGNRIVNRTVEQNYADFENINFAYMMLSGFCLVCLVCLYQPFMKIWVKEDAYMLNISSVLLLSALFYVQKMGDVQALYTSANGLYWENKYRYLLEAGLHILLNFVLVKKLGVNGVVLASILSLFIGSTIPSPIILFKKYFKMSTIRYFFTQLKYLVFFVILTAMSYFVCQSINITGFISLIVYGVVCLIVCSAGILLVFRKSPHFKYAYEMVKRRLKKI